MPARRQLPPKLTETPFSRRTARSLGVRDGRLAAADLLRPFHGVRASASLPSDLGWRCRAYQEWMNPAHVFSHHTAAELYGLPLPMYAKTDELHVSAPAPLRAPQSRGVAGHRMSGLAAEDVRDLVLRDPETFDLFAFRVVSPAMIWAQLAPLLDEDDLVALGDAIVSPLPRPGLLDEGRLASIDELRRAAALSAGARGAKVMRRALPSVREGARSRPESLFRVMIVRAGFPAPELNFDVEDQRGIVVATGDLCWPRYRLVVEYEGDYHRRRRGKFRSDVTRGELYADAGWFLVRAHAADVFEDPNSFMRRLSRRMRERGWDPGRHELRQIRNARW